MPFVIAEPCVDVVDRGCVDQCPVDCIYEGHRMLYIHPDECVDCGACVLACPVDAIYRTEELPVKWRPYEAVNSEFFTVVGPVGGAHLRGGSVRDHPYVERLP